MADKLNSGNILTTQIGGNVVLIDPNKIVTPDGQVKDRLVEQEDFVMYANLTAKIFPRSKLLVGAAAGDEIKVEIAGGDLNFLKPEGKSSLDSDWTEAFTNPDVNKKIKTTTKAGVEIGTDIQNRNDFQGFGITSISIKINSSYIPQVSINFTDVRGKTLFEQAKVNTPYTAFFHLPYPTFFLTLKGYYGKAVQYQLTLEKFVSRFDPSSGDYLVTCDFKGNHIALLRDINMHEAVTAPYMYPTRQDPNSGNVVMTKGRQTLGEVYREYHTKGLISDDIFEKQYTIVELIEKIQGIDNDMSEVFGKANLESTTHKLEFTETLKKFKEAVTGKKGWAGKYLDTRQIVRRDITVDEPPIPSFNSDGTVNQNPSNTGRTVTTAVYPLKGMSGATLETDPTKKLNAVKKIKDNARQALEAITNKYIKLMSQNPTFNFNSDEEGGKYAVTTRFNDPSFDVWEASEVKGNVTIGTTTTQLNPNLAPWFAFEGGENSFMTIWLTTKRVFESKGEQLANDLSVKLNSRLQKVIGFKPTIRNIFSIILAGADTFLKLLDDVHTEAFAQRENEQRLLAANSSDDTIKNVPKNKQIVYPWPQYYKIEEQQKGDGCSTTSSVLTYPGANDVIANTLANNSKIWPEVAFVEEYTKATNYKFASFNPTVVNEGIDKDFTPISVEDWPPTNTPYDNPEDVELWFEILNRAQSVTLNGGIATRLNVNSTGNAQLGYFGPAITELAKYDALNLYKRIRDYSTRKQIFLDISGLGQILNILVEAEPARFLLYQTYGVITPYDAKPTFTINYKPNAYTVVGQEFTMNSAALEIGKMPGFWDLAPCIFGPWVKDNFANGKSASPNDFYNISKNLTYDIFEKNVLTDTWTTLYFTKAKYNSSDFIDFDQVQAVDRRYEAYNLNTVDTVDEVYESCIAHKLVTEGEIHVFPSTTPSVAPIPPATAATVGTNSTKSPTRLTSMLNTPYFINSLLVGVHMEKNNLNANPYTQSAYLFLNSLPLPTFREKALSSNSQEGVEFFGDYISQMFNQMPAVHKIPVSLMLKIGSVWWRYKEQVKTQIDPLSSIWGNVGFAAPLGYTGPANVYDDVSGNLNTPNYYNVNIGGNTYPYATQQVANSIMQVGVYPGIIDAINFIATGVDTYINMGAGQVLNNLVGTGRPLTIEPNSNLKYTATDGTEVNFYDVYLNSANITSPTNISNPNQSEQNNFHILYPSSGGLEQTDASTYDAPTFGNTALHNGASRILWGASNYGYFEHRPGFQPTESQYFKKINNTIDQQEAWEFREDGDYSTIEVLRGVFNTEQLDAFEQEFLTFATPLGSSSLGGSLKQLIKELVVVENSWVETVAPTAWGTLVGSKKLAEAQLLKFNTSMFHFLNKKVEYIHRTTTNLDLVVGNETLLQRLNLIHMINNNEDDGVYFDNISDIYGTYSSSVTPIPAAASLVGFPLNPPAYQAVRIFVGEHYAASDPQFVMLTTENLSNPIYEFFTSINKITPDGIEFNAANVEAFAPFIRLYASQVALTGVVTNGAAGYLDMLMDEIAFLQTPQELYINNLLSEVKKLIKENIDEDETTLNVITDDRPEVKSDDLKLELYNQFKIINDRWVSGTNLTDQTLFEKFLFLDRGNQDIGDEAIINIWDILKLDSPFEQTNSTTLTQSVASYLSIILGNNYFNFIPLPSYINFFNVEKKGLNTQLQGNAMFGTFKTVDYIDSSPAFLCQYVGKPSSQLNVKTPNNGYEGDSFNFEAPNNPLITDECGDKKLSNKVMGFNVDFGIPNQNIFESITLDQSQFQNTAESFKILQSMADSGGGGATSPASVSLFNIYASRSYTAKVSCVGNVTIQPTQYFQLRYLPMFNGPYLITSVDHEVRPNTIETTFEGVRVPRPVLPNIKDLIQRVNKKLYEKAEERLGEIPIDLYFDGLSATPSQKKLGDDKNNHIATAATYQSPSIVADNVTWEDVTLSAGTFVVTPNEDPEKLHLGVDITPTSDKLQDASDINGGILVYPTIYGVVKKVVDGCKPLEKENNCGKYGNHIEIKTNINVNPNEDETSYYLTRYAFLREGVLVNIGDEILRNEVGVGTGKKILGKIGNSGLSKEVHLHLEIKRGVKKKDKIIEHYLNPAYFLPRTR